jgi:ATP-dependent Lhr-like helicase
MLVERIVTKKTLLLIFHVVAGRAVNRSLAWVLARRLGKGASVAANYDDHSFLLTLDERDAPDQRSLREAFCPEGWAEDLNQAISSTERLGARFRRVAETGQLLPRRVVNRGQTHRPSRWSASVLYATLREHEPEHPLVWETVREMLEDECDAEAAHQEAARIYGIEWDVRDLPRPSPFGLPVFAAFNRETLLAGDADRALEDLVTSLYAEWEQTV